MISLPAQITVLFALFLILHCIAVYNKTLVLRWEYEDSDDELDDSLDDEILSAAEPLRADTRIGTLPGQGRTLFSINKHTNYEALFRAIPARGNLLPFEQCNQWNDYNLNFYRVLVAVLGVTMAVFACSFFADSFGKPGNLLGFLPGYTLLTERLGFALFVVIAAWGLVHGYYWVQVLRREARLKREGSLPGYYEWGSILDPEMEQQ